MMAPARKKQRLVEDAVVSDEHTTEALTDISALSSPKPTAIKTNASAKEASQQSARSLFVRSLPASTTSESLAELFSDSYPVKHAVAVTDPSTKQCRGYGFVTFADVEDAQRAKTEFAGRLVDGRKIRLEIADPRQREAKDGEINEAKARREQAKAEAHQAPKLIVRNLPWTIKSSVQLANLFLSYGKIKQAYMPKRSGGLLPGFGFVLMRGRKNAEKAIAGVNGKEVDGRTIAVDWAVEKDVYQQAAQTSGRQSGSQENGEDSVNDSPADGSDTSDMDEDVAEESILQELGDEGDDNDDDGDEDDNLSIDGEDTIDGELDEEALSSRREDRSSTLFVRNLPFTCTDEILEDHFSAFGAVRYARIVVDAETERSKGTGFVCFYSQDDADTCMQEAPLRSISNDTGASKNGKTSSTVPSLLQNTDADPAGKYTLDGRLLQISRAVDKSEANRLTQEGVANRFRRDRDKRRLYLLSEGTISSRSQLWESLPPSERTMREASMKQRKTLIESNPSLHLSLTRLSIRNIPRSISSKELKAVAREAVVGFAKDVKEGKRQRLSQEELGRGGEESVNAEQARRAAGKGVVKQAKVVFEGESGGKVSESSGAGRSRGYGFIEYHTHRNALMGLRWLNGHAVGYQVNDPQSKGGRDALQDRKKRLIVEFAIENAQVILRRREREQKARDRSKSFQKSGSGTQSIDGAGDSEVQQGSRKRKRSNPNPYPSFEQRRKTSENETSRQTPKKPVDEKIAQRNRIIGRKRASRRTRRGEGR